MSVCGGYRSRLLLFSALLLHTLAGAQQSNSGLAVDHNFQAAVADYEAHNYRAAAARLQALPPRALKSFEVQELLGLTYAAQADRNAAVTHLQAAVDLQPGSAAARTNLAAALLHSGNTSEAEAQDLKALALDPHVYNANHNLAELYIQSTRIASAIPLLEEAQRLRPEAYDNTYDLALADLVTGRLLQAREQAARLVVQHDSGEVHNLLGRIDEQEGKYLEAANEFAAAAHLDPSEDNLFVWASELLLHRTYEPAIAVFEQATERYPKSPRLWIGLGMALYSRGEYDKSIRSLLTAADLNPSDPRCYLFLSKAYLSSPNQADEVISRFRRYAELEPADALALYYYAVSLWKGKRIEDPHVDYATVEALLKKSIALNQGMADSHLQLGILYAEQHRSAEALAEYERAMQIDPNMADAYYRLGQYYVRAGDKAKAQSEFERYQQLQAKHQSEVDKERAAVQQFVVSPGPASPASEGIKTP